VELVVLHQVYEHFGHGEGVPLLCEVYRVLQDGGSVIITVPDMRALAEKWITRQIEDYIYFVNMYGAYQGEEGDRHKWGYTYASLAKEVREVTAWKKVVPFDWRGIAGADIARDWWILGLEAVK
jgi:predicted SAM-dependent methyltransferase